MSEKQWLDRYSGESADELIGLEGEYRTDSLVLAFEEAIFMKIDRMGEAGLSEAERTILVVETLEREVNNGGYHQLFFNAPEYIFLFAPALDRIGCPRTAELTRGAVDALGFDGPPDQEAVNRLMEKDDGRLMERLAVFDDRYYEMAEDLADFLFEFIKRNRDTIILSP